jgi:hypothetical protein
VHFAKHNYNYEVKNEVGGACGMNGGEEDCIQFAGRKAKGKETTRNTKIYVSG